jgi:hypothetical protein
VLTPSQRGAIAETAIVHAAVRLGMGVYRPVAEGGRYDLILDVGTLLLRVQCKSAVHRGDVVVIRCRSCRRGRNGFVRRFYTSDEVDAIAAFCPELDRCFLLPLDRFSGRAEIQLRLAPARNNQDRGVNWADDFRLERLSDSRLDEFVQGP